MRVLSGDIGGTHCRLALGVFRWSTLRIILRDYPQRGLIMAAYFCPCTSLKRYG